MPCAILRRGAPAVNAAPTTAAVADGRIAGARARLGLAEGG
jgi:hypothetical protein